AAALLLEDTRTTRFKAARDPRVKPGGAVRLRAREARQVYRRSGRPGGHSEGQNTRSHPELGRENPQRRWYCALRRGRVGRRQARQTAEHRRNCRRETLTAGWSSPVARQAHNLKVIGSNPIPATILIEALCDPGVLRSGGGVSMSAGGRQIDSGRAWRQGPIPCTPVSVA